MACPHSSTGDPRSCSQCKGAVPRVVTRDPATGQLLIDGKPEDRGFVPQTSSRFATMKRTRRARAAQRAASVDGDLDVLDADGD